MLTIFYGEDRQRMLYKLDRFRKRNQYEGVENFDAAKDEMGPFLNSLDACSLFETNSLIVVDNAYFLCSKNSAKAKESKFDADQIAKRDFSMKDVVFLCPARSMDKRKKSVVKLTAEAKGGIECQIVDEKSINGVLREMLEEKKIFMDPKTFNWYAAHCGYDCLKIDKELDKFALLDDQLSLDAVMQLTSISPEDSIFKMADALFEKNYMKVMAFYKSFRSLNMEPLAILASLASLIRFVYQVRVLMDLGKSKDAIASELSASPGRIYFSMQKAGRFSADELLFHLSTLADLDQSMKSGILDKDDGFEKYFLDEILRNRQDLLSN